jgi:Protease inhibitor Inh
MGSQVVLGMFRVGISRGSMMAMALAASLLGGAALAQDTPKDASKDSSGAPPNSSAPDAGQKDSSNDPVHDMIGAWEFSNADHDKICHFNFRADTVPNGYRLEIDKNCPNLFPSTKNMVAWSVDNYGSLRLLDASGNSVVDLSEVESGMYDGFTPEEGRYILQASTSTPQLSAGDVAGDWAVTHGSAKPNCILTLSDSPLTGDILALKVKPGCGDTTVTRFSPTGWRMDEGELMLMSPNGQTWQFEQNDTNTWQRVPESSVPVLLVRQ